MFAIQTNDGKFVQVNYYIDPARVWEVVFSKNAKKYETYDQAVVEASRGLAFITDNAGRCQVRFTEYEAELKKAERRLDRVCNEMVDIGMKPYYDVCDRMKKLEKECDKLESDIKSVKASMLSIKRDIATWTRKQSVGFNVVSITEVVVSK